jgi:fructokinase
MDRDMTLTVVGLGEVLWDVYDDEKRLGGAPANLAIQVSQLGQQGIVVSRIGRDELGEEIISEVAARGLTTQYLQWDDSHPTGTVRVRLDERGVPSFDCSVDVAFDYLHLDEKLTRLAAQIDAVVFGTLAQRNPKSRETIWAFLEHTMRGFRLYDANLRGWDPATRDIVIRSLDLADGLKINELEWATFQNEFTPGQEGAEARARGLMEEFGLRWICVTLGPDGCEFYDRQGVIRSPGIRVSVVDTTGCGDAFGAGLLVQLLKGSSPGEACAFANLLGAYVATKRGAVPDYAFPDITQFRATLDGASLEK